MNWAQSIVRELRLVDGEEAPHGLYGLRQARKVGPKLPKLSSILVDPPIRLLKRMQVAQHGNYLRKDHLSFGVDGPRNVLVDVETYADTKVREFGDTFRVDKRSAPVGRCLPEFRTLLPRLSKRLSADHGRWTYSFGLLFIGHFAKEKDMSSSLQPLISPDFLGRHVLNYVGDTWKDVHGRAFWSCVHLWYIEQPQK
jgi:hypothetical protein